MTKNEQASGELTRDPSDRDPHRKKQQIAVGGPDQPKRGTFPYLDEDAIRALGSIQIPKVGGKTSSDAVHEAILAWNRSRGKLPMIIIESNTALYERWQKFLQRIKVDPEMALILLLDIYDEAERNYDDQTESTKGSIDLMKKGRGK